MQFEHIAPDGESKCVDTDISCINIENCIDQAAHGWKFRLDGKRIELSQVKQLVGYTGKSSSSAEPVTATRKVRSIRCKNNNKIYRNMSEAGKDLGIDSAQISYSLKVGRPTKGYEFEFVDDSSVALPVARQSATTRSNEKVVDTVTTTPHSAASTQKKTKSFADLAKQVKG